MTSKLPAGTVLRYNKERLLKIPSNQFNEISYEDVAEVLYTETDDYTEIIYRFKINDLKNGKQIRIEQKRIELINAEHEKAIKIERKLNGKKPCDFCGEPITNGHVKFVNIAHNPATHYFCKKGCKQNFIHKLQGI